MLKSSIYYFILRIFNYLYFAIIKIMFIFAIKLIIIKIVIMKNQTLFMQKLVKINSYNNSKENELINMFNIAKNEQLKLIIELVNQKRELNVDINKDCLNLDNFHIDIQKWIKNNNERTLKLCEIENELKNALTNYNSLFTDDEDEEIKLDELSTAYDIFSLPTIENLENAIENGNIIIVDRIIKKNIELSQNNNKFIYLAVKYNKYFIVKLLIESGSIVDDNVIELINSDWFNCLHEDKSKEEIYKMKKILLEYYDKEL